MAFYACSGDFMYEESKQHSFYSFETINRIFISDLFTNKTKRMFIIYSILFTICILLVRMNLLVNFL